MRNLKLVLKRYSHGSHDNDPITMETVEVAMLFILVVLVSCLGLVRVFLSQRRAWTLITKVPGPRPLPVVGNMLDVFTFCDSEKLFTYTRNLFRNYRNISRINALHLRAISIYEPEDLEIILSSTRFNQKFYPYNFMEPWLRKGLLTNNGERWQQRRKLLTPAFHFSILRQFQWSLAVRTRQLVARAEDQLGAPSTRLPDLITPFLLAVMCDTSMGITLDDEQESNQYIHSLHTISQGVIYRLLNMYYPEWLYNLTAMGKLQKKALRDLHHFTTNVIQKRRERNNRTKVVHEECTEEERVQGAKRKTALLDILLEEEKKGHIDELGIREEVDTFMFAGHDTTAASLSFMMMRIANEPDIQNRIYEELLSIFGDSDRDATEQDLKRMNYLERCVKESLRLYPGVPYLSRYLTEEVVLGGYTIPADTTVNIHIFDIHRNSRQFPEPERFDPDRFLAERAALRHTYAYIPFSAGPRNCIGQKFAMLEMKTVMAGLLRRFRLEPVTRPQDVIFVSDLVLKSKDPIYVKFTSRK